MKDEYENLQYNSCVSKGICSVNPRISALENVLVLYLHLCVQYCIKLDEKNLLNPEIKDIILNTTAISVANPEFTENCFMKAISELKTVLNQVIEKYNEIFDKNDFKNENIYASELFKKCENITDTIKFGEMIFRDRASEIPQKIRNLYKIMLIIAKSLSINILDLKSFQCNDNIAFKAVLKLINAINSYDTNEQKLINIIYEGAECNTKLMDALHEIQEQNYGVQGIYSVSYTTKPAKAVLVVGSNIKELEIILEALKNKDIDIYTHDDMMVAHTFPRFNEYKNLKGQYGHGVENCLIDFATFPGPIILTKHSLHNIENLYRGRLFTTDTNYFKGVMKIENNDFSQVIDAADKSKGFKRGKNCETVQIGYDYNKCINFIDSKLKDNLYKKIIVIGLREYSDNQKKYFDELIRLIDQNTLIISFSYNKEQANFLHFNTCFDSYAVVRIFRYLYGYNLPISIFLPKCGRNTIAEILYFKQAAHVNVFVGECEPIMINPSLLNTLRDVFGIKTFENAKNDAKYLNNL